MKADRPLVAFAGSCLFVAALYFGKTVLMPLALAILLAFLLAPLVYGLTRLGAPRALAVSVVVVLAFIVAGAAAAGLSWQMRGLVAELPKYRENIKAKIADIRSLSKMPMPEGVQEAIDDISKEIKKSNDEGTATETDPDEEEMEPVPVEVQNQGSLVDGMSGLLEPLGTAGFVIVLVAFILLRQGDLRDRVVRLVGLRRISGTTQALDEAAHRVSRYLLTQSFINGTFGAGIGLGLFLIGVDYALLWGILAATLRFIPYVGPWLAALFPITLSIATAPGWTQPLIVIGLFVVLELSSNLIMEPLLYSDSAGISEVAILVAIAFWTWLWGPIGFILATPLTVCIVVIGKHVPRLRFLWIMLSNEPVISTDKGFYHALLVGDVDAATAIAAENIRPDSIESGFDEILLPAVTHARNDRRSDEMDEEDERIVYATVREIADEIIVPEGSRRASDGPPRLVLLCPVGGESDEVALTLLERRLTEVGFEASVLGGNRKFVETVSLVGERNPSAVVIGAIPPDSFSRAASLCRRLRSRFPELPIVVGRWGVSDASAGEKALQAVGCDRVVADISGARKALVALVENGRKPAAVETPQKAAS